LAASAAAAKTAAAGRTLHRYNKWSSFLIVNQPSGKNFPLAVARQGEMEATSAQVRKKKKANLNFTLQIIKLMRNTERESRISKEGGGGGCV